MKLTGSLLPCAFVCSLVSATGQAQEPDAGTLSFADVPELADLPARWAAAIEDLGVPGCAIAVVKDGQLLATGTSKHLCRPNPRYQ